MKKLSLILLTIVSLFTFSLINVKADAVKDQTGKSTFSSNVTLEEDIYGMNHIIDNGVATTSGANHSQNINVFQMKTDGITSKLVTWSKESSNTGYTRSSITAAAADYEKKHPGWIVVGGINADQYFTKHGTTISDGSAIMNPSPYYPMITDGDNRFAVTPTNNSTNFIGFTNDGSKNSIISSTGLGGYRVTIIDEIGNDIAYYPVSGVNKTCGSNDTILWHATLHTSYNNRYVDLEVNTSNQLYVVENADMSYLSVHSSYGYTWGAPDTFFCKGEITNSTAKSYTLKAGQFAIETTNQELIKALSNGSRIKVEHAFANEDLNNVEAGIGYHSVQKSNGVDNTNAAWSENAYNKKQYPRALVGKKADGTYVLITADSVSYYKSYGLNFTEINAVAAHYGVTDLYQMDGGGSVTAMTRQADGSFKVTNVPSDNGDPLRPRSNLSYLFFVKRDPGLTVNQEETTYHSITLDQKEILGNAKIENLKIYFENKQYQLDENKRIVFENLKDNTEYDLKVTYDVVENNKTVQDEIYLKIKTKAYEFPSEPFIIENVSATSITIKKQESDISEYIKNVTVYVDKTEHYLGENSQLEVNELRKNSEYSISYKYDIEDPVSKMTYTTTTTPITVTTLPFETPVIVTFEESMKTSSAVGIKYEYKDPDSVVEKAYILYNGNIHELSIKNGTATITGLDFSANAYEFRLIIEYKNTSGRLVQVESSPISYEQTENVGGGTQTSSGCAMSAVNLVSVLLSTTALLGLVFRKRH